MVRPCVCEKTCSKLEAHEEQVGGNGQCDHQDDETVQAFGVSICTLCLYFFVIFLLFFCNIFSVFSACLFQETTKKHSDRELSLLSEEMDNQYSVLDLKKKALEAAQEAKDSAEDVKAKSRKGRAALFDEEDEDAPKPKKFKPAPEFVIESQTQQGYD